MKVIRKNVNRRLYTVEVFDSVLELANIIKKRVVQDKWKNHALSKENISADPNWYGVSSYEEAYDLLSGGWEKETKKIASLVDKVAKSAKKTKTQFYNDVCGFAPIVPLALIGVPNSMINTKRIEQKSKILNVIYDNTASWKISSESMIEAGIKLVETIINLEMSGYRVELSVLTSSVDKKYIDFSLTNIKKANQSINLKKMMFPMAHSAWLRVIGFDWQDKSPVTHYMKKRGTPFYNGMKKGLVYLSDLKEVFGKNTIYLDYITCSEGETAIKKRLLEN